MHGRKVSGKCACVKAAMVTSPAPVRIAAASTFIAVDVLLIAWVPSIRASITIGGVTISIPSSTVVSHDRKKSMPAPASIAINAQTSPALTTLAPSAAAQKRATERGTMNDSRSEEHTSELQSLMRISYAVFCLKKKKQTQKR